MPLSAAQIRTFLDGPTTIETVITDPIEECPSALDVTGLNEQAIISLMVTTLSVIVSSLQKGIDKPTYFHIEPPRPEMNDIQPIRLPMVLSYACARENICTFGEGSFLAIGDLDSKGNVRHCEGVAKAVALAVKERRIAIIPYDSIGKEDFSAVRDADNVFVVRRVEDAVNVLRKKKGKTLQEAVRLVGEGKVWS